MLPAPTIRTAIEERLFEPGRREPILWAPASGGLSEAAVWRVVRGETAFAVRRWWKGIDPRYVAWVSTTLNEVVGSGLEYVSAPLADDDRWPLIDSQGDRWEATPWMPGTALAKKSEDGEAVAAAVEGLVEFHRRVRGRSGCPTAARSSFVERSSRLEAAIARTTQVPALVTELFPELAQIAARLPAAASQAIRAVEPWARTSTGLQPIHGDARPEHFLVEENRLSGLIDFGAMRVDTPLADLARLAGELAAGDAEYRDSVVETYAAALEIGVEHRAIAALDFSGAVLSGANWLRWLSTPGGVSRDPELVRERLRSILARLGTA